MISIIAVICFQLQCIKITQSSVGFIILFYQERISSLCLVKCEVTYLLVNYVNLLLQVTENTTSLFVTKVTSSSILYTSQHPTVIARTVIYCVVWPVSIMFGICGNTLSLVVLGKYGDSSSTSMFLKSLAVADTMTLLIRSVQMVFVWRELFWADQYLAWKLSSFSFVKCSHLSERIGNSITVAIVFERVVAVTRTLSV